MSEVGDQEPVETKPIDTDASIAVAQDGASEGFGANKSQIQPVKKEENLLASLGFALGFGALFFLNTYAIPSAFGLIFSVIGLGQIKRKDETGRGLAIWGIVFSLLGIAWLGLQALGVITTPGMLFNFIKGILGFRT